MLTQPIVDGVIRLSRDQGFIVLALGVGLLFVSLRYLVILLRMLLLGRSEKLINKYLFGPAPLMPFFLAR